jgi:hypothetical protein
MRRPIEIGRRDQPLLLAVRLALDGLRAKRRLRRRAPAADGAQQNESEKGGKGPHGSPDRAGIGFASRKHIGGESNQESFPPVDLVGRPISGSTTVVRAAPMPLRAQLCPFSAQPAAELMQKIHSLTDN